ncbi:kinase-like domain-containing protein [Crassisporium funariophilum]|nr:kinase-like domain-containing protein [Crassisporium funariophilum]
MSDIHHRSRDRQPRPNSFVRYQDAFRCGDSDPEDSPSSPTCSESSVDEDEVNCRIKPFWPKYQAVFKSRGFELDTVKDVKLFYSQQNTVPRLSPALKFYSRDEYQDDDSLCPDSGLPDNLFRGTRVLDAKRVVVKAVHAGSREYDVICTLSRDPLRNDPMNHTIRESPCVLWLANERLKPPAVLDLFRLSSDNIAFIVMEEWSSQLITSSGSCCMMRFLAALRQCIEHATFMHRHHIAHLDISLRNLLTDYDGHYAYIDYEMSRQFDPASAPLVHNYRGTELPPECEGGLGVDAYKVDVWALAVLVLRACKLTGYWVPEFMYLIKPMLDEEPNRRPSSFAVLHAFDKLVTSLGLQSNLNCAGPHQ